MKISYRVGDLLEAPEKVLCHGCNAQGVMGSGVALAIKKKWPSAFFAYNVAHRAMGGLKLGDVVWATTFDQKLIANCVTQESYGRDGKRYVDYDAVRSCMREVNRRCAELPHDAIAMPMIGAGLGGGDWSVISKVIEEEIVNVKPIVYVLSEKDIPKCAAS